MQMEKISKYLRRPMAEDQHEKLFLCAIIYVAELSVFLIRLCALELFL